MASDRLNGVVKFFKAAQGYGFIWPGEDMQKPADLSEKDGGRREYFFHATDFVTEYPGEVDVRSGDEVEFELAEGKKGVSAIAVVCTKKLDKRAAISSSSVPNMTVGVRKSHIPLLVSVLKDLLDPKNSGQFNQNETDALSLLFKTLNNAEVKMNYIATRKETTSSATPTVTKVSKPKKEKNTHQTA